MLRARIAQAAAVVGAAVGGVLIAAGIGSAGVKSQTVTLGSTSGTASTNVAMCSITCTFVPFLGVSNPELQVPFDGTVTSFSVVASSGPVSLRVLRPASGGQFTGAGTSPDETITNIGGVNTYAVSMPVKAGDVLGLDNGSSAIMFDTSSATPITAYYELPPLMDGQTAPPSHSQSGYRLLMSAVVQAATTTSTTTSTSAAPPALSHVAQSHRTWRERSKPAKITKAGKPPIGTAFSFALNVPARVTLTFKQRVSRRCASTVNHHRCNVAVVRGHLSFTGHAGTNSVSFYGRVSQRVKLPLGSYTLTISATNNSGAAQPKTLRFTIVGG